MFTDAASERNVASLTAKPSDSNAIGKSTAKLVSNDKMQPMEIAKPETKSTIEESNRVVASETPGATAEEMELDYALAGKCPVTLIKERRWADGDKQFGCLHRGRLYLFVDKVAMSTFQKDPEMYSPMLAGYDPVLFHEAGDLVDGLAKHGVFMGKAPSQKIVLFSSHETRSKFQTDPQKFMKTIRLAVEQSNRNIK